MPAIEVRAKDLRVGDVLAGSRQEVLKKYITGVNKEWVFYDLRVIESGKFREMIGYRPTTTVKVYREAK